LADEDLGKLRICSLELSKVCAFESERKVWVALWTEEAVSMPVTNDPRHLIQKMKSGPRGGKRKRTVLSSYSHVDGPIQLSDKLQG
jgi:hypothetical protein